MWNDDPILAPSGAMNDEANPVFSPDGLFPLAGYFLPGSFAAVRTHNSPFSDAQAPSDFRHLFASIDRHGSKAELSARRARSALASRLAASATQRDD
jgi:hypothetical protein